MTRFPAPTVLRLLGGAAAPSLPVQAIAQTSAPPADTKTPDIVVSGQRPAVQTSIDRKSYATARDLQATTGSAVDVLRNVPSVSVDVDGTLSLRGDANVQILVDGRPSPQFNNGNRAAALEALGADGICSAP